MPTSLVTGVAGFIGSHVVDNILMTGHEVVALDDLSGGFEENMNPKAKFIKGSVEDCELVQGIFEKYRFDYIYYLAAYAAELGLKESHEMFGLNYIIFRPH